MRPLRYSAEPDSVRLPQPPPAPINPAGFVILPAASLPGHCPEQWLWQLWLYQRCFEAAQAVVQPALTERDLAGVWN
jgi:hypothetical protein